MHQMTITALERETFRPDLYLPVPRGTSMNILNIVDFTVTRRTRLTSFRI